MCILGLLYESSKVEFIQGGLLHQHKVSIELKIEHWRRFFLVVGNCLLVVCIQIAILHQLISKIKKEKIIILGRDCFACVKGLDFALSYILHYHFYFKELISHSCVFTKAHGIHSHDLTHSWISSPKWETPYS